MWQLIKYDILTWMRRRSRLAASTSLTVPPAEFSYSSTGVTVILTVWKRNHIIEQLEALARQTVKPDQVWIYQCGNFVDTQSIPRYNFRVELIKSTVNLKYFGRFMLAGFVPTKYVWILDDDVIPGSQWLANSRTVCENESAIVSCTGRIIPKGDYLPERMSNISDYFFGDVLQKEVYNTCLQDTIVDFGCNSWFYQSKWTHAFWQTPPCTLETAEDIHLSASCKITLGISTIVLKQEDITTSGNTKIKYGRDEFASWLKPGFQQSRENTLRYLINDKKWRPLQW